MRVNALVETAELHQEVATLSAEESHHIARVLRAVPGQEVALFDGHGGLAEAVISNISKKAVTATIVRRWSEPPPPVHIELIQAVPATERWEMVLQKAVELGVSAIQPVLTQHTAFKPDGGKMERWKKVVLNAAQQCEVRWLPVLHAPQPMQNLLPQLAEYDRALIASLYPGAVHLRDAGLDGAKRIALLVGPEGDFTEAEVHATVNAGACPISFGTRILRTETAAIFGLSVLAYELL